MHPKNTHCRGRLVIEPAVQLGVFLVFMSMGMLPTFGLRYAGAGAVLPTANWSVHE